MSIHDTVGLSETEMQCYRALLEAEDYKPSELAKIVNQTRTNCYKILDRLETNKLVERVNKSATLRYRAVHPARLLQLAQERRAAQAAAEQDLERSVESMINSYAKTHEQPGVRHFAGREEIREIFADQVKVGKPIHFIHTIAGIDFYTYEQMHDIRMMAVNAGIPRYALTPDTHLAHANYQAADKHALLTRTWMRDTDYTAPVEWGAYGDKTYIVSYGSEAMGMTIESPQIAEAFRQMFAMMERGQRAQSWYKELPRLARKVSTLGS